MVERMIMRPFLLNRLPNQTEEWRRKFEKKLGDKAKEQVVSSIF